MKKRLTGCITAVMIFCSFTVHGQEAAKNLISFGINFSDEFPYSEIIIRPGLNLGYERLLNKSFSVGLEIGTNLTVWPYGEIQGRWYYWADKLYLGFGFGTICIWGWHPGYSNFLFPLLSPEIGWKINIGKANKRAIIISLSDRMNFRPLYTNILELNFKIGRKF